MIFWGGQVNRSDIQQPKSARSGRILQTYLLLFMSQQCKTVQLVMITSYLYTILSMAYTSKTWIEDM